MAAKGKKVSEIVLEYRIEDNDADKRAKQLLQNMEEVADAAGMVANEADRMAKSVSRTSQTERQLDAALDDTENRLRGTADEARKAAAAVEDYGDAARRARDETESFGDVGTNLSALSGLARAAGAGGVADVGMLLADISDATEGLGRLGPALGEVGNKAVTFLNSMGPFGIAAVAAAGAVAGLVIGLKLFSQGMADADRDIQAFINTQQEYYDIIREGTTEDVQGAIDAQRTLIADLTTQRDEIAGVLDQSYAEAGAQLGVFTGLLIELADVPGVDAARARLDQLNLELHDAEFFMGRLGGAINSASVAANDAAAAEEHLAEMRDEATEAAIAAARAEDEASVNAKFDRQLDLLNIERDRAKLEEDLIDLGIRNNQVKADARKASAAAIDNMEAGFAKFLESANKQIGQETAKAAQARAKIESDYMAKEVKATSDYRREELRDLEDFNKERIRRIEDLNNDLLSAEEANDVVAFIRTQRQGQQDLRRMDEDASLESQRRSQDFQAEQKERKAETAQRLIDLRLATQQRIIEIRNGITQQRALLQEQIAAERDALVQRIDDLNQGLRLEIMTRRKGFEQALIDQAAFNAQTAALEQQRQNALLTISHRGYQNIADQVSAVFAGKQAYAGASSSALSGYSGGSTRGGRGLGGSLSSQYASLSSGGKGFLGNIANTTSSIFNFSGNIGSGMSSSQIQNSVQSGVIAAIKTVSGAYTLSKDLL